MDPFPSPPIRPLTFADLNDILVWSKKTLDHNEMRLVILLLIEEVRRLIDKEEVYRKYYSEAEGELRAVRRIVCSRSGTMSGQGQPSGNEVQDVGAAIFQTLNNPVQRDLPLAIPASFNQREGGN
jgi:hypothetical protein